MNSYCDSGSGISDAFEGSPNGIYDYKLKTPFRVNANASVIVFKMATSFGRIRICGLFGCHPERI